MIPIHLALGVYVKRYSIGKLRIYDAKVDDVPNKREHHHGEVELHFQADHSNCSKRKFNKRFSIQIGMGIGILYSYKLYESQ
jgi:hypothetical protein